MCAGRLQHACVACRATGKACSVQGRVACLCVILWRAQGIVQRVAVPAVLWSSQAAAWYKLHKLPVGTVSGSASLLAIGPASGMPMWAAVWPRQNYARHGRRRCGRRHYSC
jgi:hypothetical protein